MLWRLGEAGLDFLYKVITQPTNFLVPIYKITSPEQITLANLQDLVTQRQKYHATRLVLSLARK